MVLLQKSASQNCEGSTTGSRPTPLCTPVCQKCPTASGAHYEQRDSLLCGRNRRQSARSACHSGRGHQSCTNTVEAHVQLQPHRVRWSDVPGHGNQRADCVKLPSPEIGPGSALDLFLQLNYAAARTQRSVSGRTIWPGGPLYRARAGGEYAFPGQSLACPAPAARRHAQSRNGKIDLPYSNFAYDQQGTPWPVNQAVYVDYMLYDLRGYHTLAAEELSAIYRNNQQPNGHVGGYANWGVYTPGMLYAVAQHFLLSHNQAPFERLLPGLPPGPRLVSG